MQFVDYQQTGQTAVIRLNRPERMNSLSQALLRDLDEAWRIFQDGDARVAVYTGTGRAFCAGMDVKEAASRPAEEVRFPEPPLTVFHAGAITKPVIAAVNGHAIGGGFFDVLRCDLRIAGEAATFQLAEVHRSVLPHPLINGIAGALPDCLVTELALGSRIDAQRAHEMGLLNRVVADDELLDTATAMAEEIAGLPPLAVEATLEGLRRARSLRSELEDADLRQWQAKATAMLAGSQDHAEALASFLEKRPPAYVGR